MFCKAEKTDVNLMCRQASFVWTALVYMQYFYIQQFFFFQIWLLPGKMLYEYMWLTWLMPVQLWGLKSSP